MCKGNESVLKPANLLLVTLRRFLKTSFAAVLLRGRLESPGAPGETEILQMLCLAPYKRNTTFQEGRKTVSRFILIRVYCQTAFTYLIIPALVPYK